MMGEEAQRAVRNSALLVGQRGVYVLGGLVFAVVVPRLMGPGVFGRYALFTSLAVWFGVASTLGFTQVLGRFVPALMLEGDDAGIRRLLGNLLAVRLLASVVVGAAYLLLTAVAFGGIDLWVLTALAGAVFVRAVSHLLFALNLGLNQAARWAMGETVRRWASLVCVVAGFWLSGLFGACVGLLLSELVVWAVGMRWARPYLARRAVRLDLRFLGPYLRFGLLFFVSILLVSALDHSGEALVQAVSGDYAQVGFFGVTLNVYLVAVSAVVQFGMAFTPLLGGLWGQGEREVVRRWVGRLLKWLAVVGVLLVYGALFLAGDVVPLVFGRAYRPATSYLLPLSLALLAVGPSSVASVLALVCDQPRVAIAASSIHLAAFWTLGAALTAWLGGFGACVAVFASAALSAAYAVARTKALVGYTLREWVLAVALGMPFLPMVALRGAWPVDVALFAAFCIGYGALLFGLRVVTLRECGAGWSAVRRAPARGQFMAGEVQA